MFGIRAIDRSKHMYVIGKTGMGKSTLLENLAIQDIQNGEGLCYIDPHGSTAEKLLDFVPHNRIKDVIYFAPFDTEVPVGFNVMEDVGYDKRHLVVSGLMGAFKRIWEDAWSARMEYILQNVLLALLEYPDSTLIDVNRMLTNKKFRAAVIEKITDPLVRSFWVDEFAGYTDRYTQEATPAIQNKVGQFVSNPLIRNIVGQPRSTFDLRKIMDEKKIFIANLSKGRMGESNASLLGSMLTVKIYLAAMSRAEEPAARMARLPRCFFYVDEFQSMMNESFAAILSESRKYKLALTLANQYVAQMEENVRDAVFGNIGTFISFRVGPFDAEVLKTMFEPTFMPEDLVNLGIGQIYLTLMVDGVGTPPFSAETIPPIDIPNISYRDDVIRASRESFGKKRSDVEAFILHRQSEFAPDPPKPKDKRDFAPRPPQHNGYTNHTPRDVRPRPFPERTERPLESAPQTHQVQPSPVARPPRQENNQPRRADVPAREPREFLKPLEPLPKPQPARDALKDAIASATGGSMSAKSPLELLREKKAKAGNPAAKAAPVALRTTPLKHEVVEEPVRASVPPNTQEHTRKDTRPHSEAPVPEVGVSQELLEKLLKGD